MPDEQRLIVPIFSGHAEPAAPLMFTTGPSRGEAIGALGGEPLYHSSLVADEYPNLLDANGSDVAMWSETGH